MAKDIIDVTLQLTKSDINFLTQFFYSRMGDDSTVQMMFYGDNNVKLLRQAFKKG